MVMAAFRDASWYSNPDTGTSRKYHISIDDMAACNRQVPLYEDGAVEADTVYPHMRCQRRGCKSRWPVEPTTKAARAAGE